MAAVRAVDAERENLIPLRAKLLGNFLITLGDKIGGPWERPTGKRLCELLMMSPGWRISRERACAALFPDMGPTAAGRALSKALSVGRDGLAHLGDPGRQLLLADRAYIWANTGYPLEVDLDRHQQELRVALEAAPGPTRDELLEKALRENGRLLEGEPFAEWALGPRARLEWARQEARLTLARDRARGLGRSMPAEVEQAWDGCLSHDGTCEEAACALMRLYAAQTRWALVEATYGRCRAALEELGLSASPALEEVHAASRPGPALLSGAKGSTRAQVYSEQERRIVTCLCLELSGPASSGRWLGPEDLSERVGNALAEVVGHVETLGGTVTAVSGAGLVALFGAPTTHEDDPERALLAAYRIMKTVGHHPEGPLVRAGVETGQAVVGGLPTGGPHYGALGEVVTTAAALQSVARATSVLVGPSTHGATVHQFDWGPTEEVAGVPGAKPLRARYLERPTARRPEQNGRRRLGAHVPVLGREAELDLLRGSLRDVTAGKGGVVLISGEPGLGKTRLVHEFHRLFMAWVGAGSGRLPLWLEGRAASYLASRPYGLYQQLLFAWLGIAPEESEELAFSALDRGLTAVLGRDAAGEHAELLSMVMGIAQGNARTSVPDLTPEQLQRATFDAVRSVISSLVAHGPTVLVLEDLHWADPTSLRLTEELSGVTKTGPLLLILTRRAEPDPGVSALEADLGASYGLRLDRLQLASLPEHAERDLVIALMGEESANEVMSAVSYGAEGNPFFIEERFSSLLETGALVRDEDGWNIDHSLSVEVPGAIERLVRSRVDRLGPGPRSLILAASVLGPEFGERSLRAVSDVGRGLRPALAELREAGLFVEVRKEPEPSYRFRHSLIQEATYNGLLRADRRQLHARAAWGLERSSAGRLEEVAGVLGHHFAVAGEAGRAAFYLQLAGARAARGFANDEAVTSYRYALDVLSSGRAGPKAAGGDAEHKAEVDIRAELAEVLWQTGRHTEASETLVEGLDLVRTNGPQTARLHNRLGWAELDRHEYVAATSAFQAALVQLGHHTQDMGPEVLDLWVDTQLGLALVHYWRDEPGQMAAILAAVGPVFDVRGGEVRRQLSRYLGFARLARVSERRLRVDEEMVDMARRALVAAKEFSDQVEIGWSLFGVGFSLLWNGQIEEAEEWLTDALHTAERTGAANIRAVSLAYLNLAALRRDDPAGVGLLAPQAIDAAYAASKPQYAATAKASLAWMAWKTGRFDEVEALAEEALAPRPDGSWQPFRWVCLWPLIAVRLFAGQLAEAVEAAYQLLLPSQQRFPDELEAEVQAAIRSWEQGNPERTGEVLARALELAQEMRFA